MAWHGYAASQREKLNAVVGYATQMTLLLSHYLGVMLPYEIFMLDAQPMIRQRPWVRLTRARDRLRSLVSTDRNTEAFVTALALLAYNVAYLCFSQDVIIPVEQTVYLLENIAACCQAPGLGRWGVMILSVSTLVLEQGTDGVRLCRDMTDTRQSTAADSKVFGIELARVVQMHAACWTTGKPWELVSMPPPTHSADGLGTHVGNESAEDGDGAWDLVDGSDRPI
ncbi:hypothetical protein BC831DRAFT_397818 [Entophlyctis helioformis]|nr:hypothetical protein BC831DRAFT_397818 [Entophlyctis helioformis]